MKLFLGNTLLWVLLISFPWLASSQENDVVTRIQNRIFPSLFQPWGEAEHFNDNLSGTTSPLNETSIQTMAHHDLIWRGLESYGLKSLSAFPGLAQSYTPESIKKGLEFRKAILKLNPNAIMLAEIRYYADQDGYIPAD